jgi:hypothetical protein
MATSSVKMKRYDAISTDDERDDQSNSERQPTIRGMDNSLKRYDAIDNADVERDDQSNSERLRKLLSWRFGTEKVGCRLEFHVHEVSGKCMTIAYPVLAHVRSDGSVPRHG